MNNNQLLPILTRPTQLEFRRESIEPYDDEYRFVNANTLMSDPWPSTNKTVMVVVTLYIKACASSDVPMSYYTRSDRNNKATYDKMLVGMDVNAVSGQNIVVFLLGKGQNERFFQGCLRMRDTGELGEYVDWYTTVYLYHSAVYFILMVQFPKFSISLWYKGQVVLLSWRVRPRYQVGWETIIYHF